MDKIIESELAKAPIIAPVKNLTHLNAQTSTFYKANNLIKNIQ